MEISPDKNKRLPAVTSGAVSDVTVDVSYFLYSTVFLVLLVVSCLNKSSHVESDFSFFQTGCALGICAKNSGNSISTCIFSQNGPIFAQKFLP